MLQSSAALDRLSADPFLTEWQRQCLARFPSFLWLFPALSCGVKCWRVNERFNGLVLEGFEVTVSQFAVFADGKSMLAVAELRR
jgi:hypothetical protein